MFIKNIDELILNTSSLNDAKARELALISVEKALESVEPRKLINSHVRIVKNKFIVGKKELNLDLFNDIYIIGGGKASGAMAETIENILGDRIKQGLIVVPKKTSNLYKTKNIKLHESNHPIPNKSSVEGARNLLNLASDADINDLVICLISGGGSSLMALPKEEINLEEKKKINDMLLKSGANINEINTVRKHISNFKGGNLARKVYPATLLTIILSDVIGDDLSTICSGPTVPDMTTYDNSINILRKYKLWNKSPNSIQKVLSDGKKGLIIETPKKDDKVFRKSSSVLIGNNRLLCSSACKKMKDLGINSIILTGFLEGEARELGVFLGSIAKEIVNYNGLIMPPVGIVCGGETTVKVTGKGIGGRNQEILLGATKLISDLKAVSIISLSSDGIDGPTDAAGAIIDGNTFNRSKKLGMQVDNYLQNNNSYSYFSKLNDLVYTDSTGTNVNDITILIIL
jgi:glycerate-2-kinase